MALQIVSSILSVTKRLKLVLHDILSCIMECTVYISWTCAGLKYIATKVHRTPLPLNAVSEETQIYQENELVTLR
jgi:hypothetical protein